MNLIKLLVFGACLCFSVFASAGQVNINTADVPTLTKEMQGIGKTRAEAIVEYRKQHGPFKSVDDLTQVDGIGNRTLEINRENIVLK